MIKDNEKTYIYTISGRRYVDYEPSTHTDPISGSYLIMMRPRNNGGFMVAAENCWGEWSLSDLLRSIGGYGEVPKFPLISEPTKQTSTALYGGNFEYNNGVWSSSQSSNFGLTRHDPVIFDEFISKLTLEERIKS